MTVQGNQRIQSKRRREAISAAVFSTALLDRLASARDGFPDMPRDRDAVLERLKREAKTIGDQFRADYENEKRQRPASEYIKILKAARASLKALHDLPEHNYILNEPALIRDLEKAGLSKLPEAQLGEAIRHNIRRDIDQALWWIETLKIHADAAVLSGKRGISSRALRPAEFAICLHSGFWKTRCGLTQEEFHDLAVGYWTTAGLPDKGNSKEGNTLRAYVVKSMKRQKNILEKLTPILTGN